MMVALNIIAGFLLIAEILYITWNYVEDRTIPTVGQQLYLVILAIILVMGAIYRTQEISHM